MTKNMIWFMIGFMAGYLFLLMIDVFKFGNPICP